MKFNDHFSHQADDYAKYRPDYPSALFEFLARVVTQHGMAWDCGTGNGQAALSLTEYFDRIIATDLSAKQIDHATRHEKISYFVVAAEQTEIPSHSVDLITVAQALHWFDVQRFYKEAQRVLKPDGVLAAWCYGLGRINPEIDKIVQHYYKNVVGPYWPPERRYIDEKYQTLPFPFSEMSAPEFYMKADWDMSDFMGYLMTWSATQAFQKKNEQNPFHIIQRLLRKTWGDPSQKHTVRWPLYLRVGKNTATATIPSE